MDEPGGGATISDQHALTGADRREFEQRRQVLRAAMAQSDMVDLAEIVLAMFDGYPTVKMDKARARSVAQTYVGAIAHLPLWAVLAGRDEMIKRDSPFPASAGELRAAAERAAAGAQEEMHKLNRVLGATVIREVSDAEREKVGQLFRGLADSLAMPRQPARAGRNQEAAAAPIDRLAETSQDYAARPVTLSPHVRKALETP